MLSVLWIIFKIIGIIILGILAVILLGIILLLFVPIRYKAKVDHDGSIIEMRSHIRWLIALVYIPIEYVDKRLNLRVRIFGFKVFDLNSEKKEKPLKKKKTKKTKKPLKQSKVPKRKKTSKDKEIDEEERKAKIEALKAKVIIKDKSTIIKEKIKAEAKEEAKEEVKKNKKENIFKRIYNKVLNIIKSVLSLVRNIKEKKEKIILMITDEKNKSLVKFLFEKIKKLLKHIGPRKIQSQIIFGMEDPSVTGQIYGFLSMFYCVYGNKVELIPDFQNKVFQGNHYIKGRIRLINLLIIALSVIRNQEVKEFIKTNKK